MDEETLAGLAWPAYLDALHACRLCPDVQPPPVVGPVPEARILLIGQAPGPKEMEQGRPFVWTAGTTLFRWFAGIGAAEDDFRRHVHMGAAIRCFPGKNDGRQGDRAPSRTELATCRRYHQAEWRRLRPALVIPVGRLAIAEFVPHRKLNEVVGRHFAVTHAAHTADVVPLPHPSGLSTWHKTEPGKTLLAEALALLAEHPAWRAAFRTTPGGGTGRA